MTKPGRVYETYKNSLGQYECQPISQAGFGQGDAAADFWAEDCEPDVANSYSGPEEQAFYIDPGIVRAVSPDWAVQAQQIFMQSLHSNFQGGHADYLKQMRIQFELMHQTLQQQMAQFSQKN